MALLDDLQRLIPYLQGIQPQEGQGPMNLGAAPSPGPPAQAPLAMPAQPPQQYGGALPQPASPGIDRYRKVAKTLGVNLDQQEKQPIFGMDPSRFSLLMGTTARAIAPNSVGGRLGGSAAALAMRDEDMALHDREQQAKERAYQADVAGMGEFAGLFAKPPAVQGGAGYSPTGTTGLQRLDKTGFGNTEAFSQQRPDLQQLLKVAANSPTAAKLLMDPQFQDMLNAGGFSTHPDVVKNRQVREDERGDAAATPDVNPILAGMIPGMTADQVRTLRGVLPSKDIFASGRLAQGTERLSQGEQGLALREQNLDLAKQIYELRKLVEGGGTAKSAAGIANTQANTGLATERTRTESGTNVLGDTRIKSGLAGIEEKYGRTAPLQSIMQQRAAQTDKTRAEIPFVGQTKGGGTPALVTAKLNEIKRLREKTIPPSGLTGLLGLGSPKKQSIEAQIEMMKGKADPVTRRAIEVAHDLYLNEQLEGGGAQETQAQPSLVGQQAPLPDGDHQLKDGRKVSVKGGIVQRMLP